MVQALARAFDDAAPAMLVAERVEPERVAVLVNVEPEIAIEMLGRLEVGNRQHELVERVYPDGRRIGGRRHIATDCRHRMFLFAVAPSLALRAR